MQTAASSITPVGNPLPDEPLQPRVLLLSAGVRRLPPLPAPHQHRQVGRHELLVRRRVEVFPAQEPVFVIRAKNRTWFWFRLRRKIIRDQRLQSFTAVTGKIYFYWHYWQTSLLPWRRISKYVQFSAVMHVLTLQIHNGLLVLVLEEKEKVTGVWSDEEKRSIVFCKRPFMQHLQQRCTAVHPCMACNRCN